MTLALILLTLFQWPTSGCQRLDQSLPAHYIRFEALRELVTPNESRHRIFLRLHNNTSCAVRLYEEGHADPNLRRLNYYLMDSSGRVVGGLGADDLGPRRLEPGASLVFDVPQSHFRTRHLLLVPLSYEWEESRPFVSSSKSAIFAASDIPEDARRRLRRR
jgi:hypothetical protein